MRDTGCSAARLNTGYQMDVGIVTAQSTRHMHYIMTCLSGDGCRMGVGWMSDGCRIGVI